MRTSGSVTVRGSFEGDRCLLRAALLRRTSLLLFIHNLCSSSTSVPSSTGAPVSFPVTAALTIRSAAGLFKALGTQGLDLLCHRRSSEGHGASQTEKLWRRCRCNGPLTGGGMSASARSREVFALIIHGPVWPPSRSRVFRCCEGQLSRTAPSTHNPYPDGSDR